MFLFQLVKKSVCYDNLLFPLTYIGKVEIGIYCFLIADILTKVLQKCSLSSPLRNILILTKPLNLSGCHGNQNDKFAKIYSKIISSEAMRQKKLKLCRHFHNIKLCISVCFYSLAHVFSLLWQRKFSIDLQWEK